MHVGIVDTEMTAGLEADKTQPEAVATSALDALEADQSEAIVDELSRRVKSALHDDLNLLYPVVEQQFAAQAAN